AAYYFVIRFQGLAIGGWQPYPLFIICLELVGQTAFLPYAILLLRSVYPTGSLGLPPGIDREASTAAVAGMTPRTDQTATDCRTVYLCDDGKDAEKQAFIEALSATEDVVYVSGRTRKKGEVNGKSANLNFCLHSIYASLPRSELNPEDVDWSEISNKELVVVFDSDMCAKPDFFCKARGSITASRQPALNCLPVSGVLAVLQIFEVMLDDNLALCLTPQAFHNIDPDTDLFNSINVQFWEYWLPGAFAWGYIACTGTNFCIRARALAHCGWFPEYTITEDYALGMELKSRGYKATYLNDYIAVGEAPEEIRNVFRQRSRWTKGHFQVFFSAKCPLLNFELPFFQRLWYSYAAWAPITTILTVPAFIIVPFMSIAFGIHPVTITYELVLASTLYFISQNSLQYYVHTFKHLKLMWFVNVSNTVLWFTFTKAFVNTMAAKLGFKAIMFKVTDKTKGESGNKPALPAPAPAKDGEVEKIVSASVQPTSNSLARMSHRLATAVYNSFTGWVRPAVAAPAKGKFRQPRDIETEVQATEPVSPVSGGRVRTWLHRNADAPQPRARVTSYASNTASTPRTDDTPRYASSVVSHASVRRTQHPDDRHMRRGAFDSTPAETPLASSRPVLRSTAAASQASTPTYREQADTHADYEDGKAKSSVRVPSRPAVSVKRSQAAAEPAPEHAHDEGESAHSRAQHAGSASTSDAQRKMLLRQAASNRVNMAGATEPGPSHRPEASGSQTVVSYREALPMMASFAGVGGADDRTLTAPAAAACELVVVVEGSDMLAPPEAPDMPDAAPPPQGLPRPAHRLSHSGAAGTHDGGLVEAMPRPRAVPRTSAPSGLRSSSHAPSEISASEDASLHTDSCDEQYQECYETGQASSSSSPEGGRATRQAVTSSWTKAREDMSLKASAAAAATAALAAAGAAQSAHCSSSLASSTPPNNLSNRPTARSDAQPQAVPQTLAAEPPAAPAPVPEAVPTIKPPPVSQQWQLPAASISSPLSASVPSGFQIPAFYAHSAAAAMAEADDGRTGVAGSHTTYTATVQPHTYHHPNMYAFPVPPTNPELQAYAQHAPFTSSQAFVMNPTPVHVLPVQSAPNDAMVQPRLPAPWEMEAWEGQLAKKVLQQIKDEGVAGPDWAQRFRSRRAGQEGAGKPEEPGLARFKKVMASFKPANVQDFGKMFDPLALLFLWLFCLVISVVGMWELSQTIARDTLTSFALNSPLTGNPYLMIAICWSFYNSIAPYCFLHYCFSAGKTFKFVTKWLPGISTMVLLGSIILLWMLIPTDFSLQSVLSLSLGTYLPNQIMRDTNMGVVLVTGLAAAPLSLPALLNRGPTDQLPYLNTTTFSSTGNWQSQMQTANTMPVADLVASVDLLGGLTPGVDPVKYGQPSAYAVTMLAWSLLQFPDGFTPQQAAAAKGMVRWVLLVSADMTNAHVAKAGLGADYLMRCNLNPNDPTNPVFVAQLGDPNRYVAASDQGYYPAADGKVWTSTAQDPALTGALARPAWVMTRENPGADLLTGAAAALSAASMALRRDDTAWSDLSLAHARYLYSFGISKSLDPKSACASMPCTTDIIVEEQVTAVPLVSDYDGTPKCFWADWNAKTCRVAYTSSQCDEIRASISDVFTNKQGCCDMFQNAKVWSITYTGAQGICALPENQTTCYVPDRTQRTCYEQTVDLETGVGCSGVGIEVFPTTLGCCTYLNTPVHPPAVCYCYLQCYIPSITNATCMVLTGAACAQFGAETSFDEPIGCCNRLVAMLSPVTTGALNTTGVCARGGGGVLSGMFTPNSPPPPPKRSPPRPPSAAPSPASLLTPDTATPTPPSPPTPVDGPGDYTNTPLTGTILTSSVGNVAATSSTPARLLRRGLQASTPGSHGLQQLWSNLKAAASGAVNSLAPPSTARRHLMQTDSTASSDAPVSAQPLSQTQLQTLSLAALLASLVGSPSSGSSAGLGSALSGLVGGGHSSDQHNQTQWPLPQATDALKYDPCAAGTCRIMTVNRTKTVPFFNSTTVLDDMAWGAVWMYKATREPQYLGQAELFMKRHKQGLRVLLAVLVWLQEEMAADSLQFTRQYYVPDWNNVAWATDVLLANITDSNVYHGRLRTLLATWSYADSLPTVSDHNCMVSACSAAQLSLGSWSGQAWLTATSLPAAPTQPSQIKARTNPLFNLQNFTDATTNSSYAIVPECRPTALYEVRTPAPHDLHGMQAQCTAARAMDWLVNCYDGIDDDCNGLVDKEDTACGLFPTLYTPRQIAFSSSPSLPNAASAAFLAMAYSDQVSAAASIQLRCWSLSQAGHMLGLGSEQNSYVVGYGTNPPTIVQHRDSSCPAGPAECSWSSGFYPNTPNPQLQLIQGALVAGPGLRDDYVQSRANNQTAVSVVNNVAFTGLLAALTDTGTTLRSCEGLHGVWQRYVIGEKNI
ncbi:hypothetical protein QJQ45_020227, partial [Haematococcus lacustris]